MAYTVGRAVGRSFREPTRPRATTTGTRAASNQRRDAALARRASTPASNKAAPPKARPRPNSRVTPGRQAPRPGPSGSFSSGGRSAGVPMSPGAEAPGAIASDQDWLSGDSTYLGQIAAFDKALADFQANQGLQRSQYSTQYATDKKSLEDAQKKGQTDLREDFAGRGLVNSGLYTQALGDLNNEFATQFSQLDTNQKNFLDNLTRELSNYQTENQLTRDQARADALRRRAAEYGI